MSETSETAETQPEAVAPDDEPKTFDASYVAKLRQEAAKYRTEAKENAAAAKRLAEIEEASKSEAQKAAERLAALEDQVKTYETREQVANWKAAVSQETGVPAAVLAGASLEEIQAHAETLKPLINTATQPPTASPVPTITQTPGRPVNLPLKDQIAAAETAGDKVLVGQLKAMMLASGQ